MLSYCIFSLVSSFHVESEIKVGFHAGGFSQAQPETFPDVWALRTNWNSGERKWPFRVIELLFGSFKWFKIMISGILPVEGYKPFEA